jgi:hypothetical protein
MGGGRIRKFNSHTTFLLCEKETEKVLPQNFRTHAAKTKQNAFGFASKPDFDFPILSQGCRWLRDCIIIIRVNSSPGRAAALVNCASKVFVCLNIFGVFDANFDRLLRTRNSLC